mmetsp:Transcript_79669/g.176789  ORF Transcript_79669/g.176789 Transcript_79669/m.176789 type:complete len:229 (-) Transcript_79669:531-1217(-)
MVDATAAVTADSTAMETREGATVEVIAVAITSGWSGMTGLTFTCASNRLCRQRPGSAATAGASSCIAATAATAPSSSRSVHQGAAASRGALSASPPPGAPLLQPWHWPDHHQSASPRPQSASPLPRVQPPPWVSLLPAASGPSSSSSSQKPPDPPPPTGTPLPTAPPPALGSSAAKLLIPLQWAGISHSSSSTGTPISAGHAGAEPVAGSCGIGGGGGSTEGGGRRGG